jgi:ribonuclease J
LGEVGRNMTVFEYGRDILIVDCGLMFPESDMLGVDLVIPDTSYLTDKLDRVRGYVITHGHEDHIGALPYVLPAVPAPVYATRLTRGLIEVKLEDHNLLDIAQLITVTADDRVRLGQFEVEFFRVTHSIPDAVGVAITCPVGLVVHTGEYKFDFTPSDGQTTDFHKLAEYGRRGVLALLSDSTNSERPGHTPSERVVSETLDSVFGQAPGRIIVSTFASNISRLQQVIDTAVRYGRKVAVAGRSMQHNMDMALKLGYLDAPAGTLVDLGQINQLADEQVVIMSTGSQGEPTSALVRMANVTHRDVRIRRGDVVILSATPIPGNEEMVHRTLDNLYRLGAHVHYQALSPVHVSGHASREDQKLMLRLVAPRFFVPIQGEYRMLALHAQLAAELGIPAHHTFVLENGQVLEVGPDWARLGEQVPGGFVYVDGLGVGDIGQVVLRDRHHLSRDGFVVVVVTVGRQSGDMVGEPEILTRGFVYQPEAEELLDEIRDYVGEVVSESGGSIDVLHTRLRDRLAERIHMRTRRRPMILPLVVEV